MTSLGSQPLAAALRELAVARRSVRAFLPDPIPSDIISDIFALAQMAPSNCNVQPWGVHVVSGDAAQVLRQELHDAAALGKPVSPDFPLTGSYPEPFRTRQIGAAKALFAATGIKREDTAARQNSFLRNFSFFDAPHAAFIFLPAWAGWREAADCGMYAQTLMLALSAHGYGACAQGALSHYADVVHRVLKVDDGSRLLFGIAFGTEDRDHPANTTRTVRATIDEAVVFHG